MSAGSCAGGGRRYELKPDFVAGEQVAPAVALGAVGFTTAVPDGVLGCTLRLPVIAGDPVCAVWPASGPVVPLDLPGYGPELQAVADGQVAFVTVLEMQRPGEMLDRAAYRAYRRVLGFLADAEYRYLTRIWHFFARIHDDEDGLERYRRFSVGRAEAFGEFGLDTAAFAPAASALGTPAAAGDSSLVYIYFIATRRAPVRVENPRQVSAFRYPHQYGPRSPVFARAAVWQGSQAPHLLISGTASIVGHESRHLGDVVAQAEETLRNLAAVEAAAGRQTGFRADPADRRQFKVYLRDPADLPVVQPLLANVYGTEPEILYLHADVCRRELLVEIEAVVGGLPAEGETARTEAHPGVVYVE